MYTYVQTNKIDQSINKVLIVTIHCYHTPSNEQHFMGYTLLILYSFSSAKHSIIQPFLHRGSFIYRPYRNSFLI